MRLQDWIQRRMAGYDGGREIPAYLAALHAIFSDGAEPPSPAADFESASYPGDLAELLRRRASVAAELLELDLTTASGRVGAIPRLQELLRRYPHPLVYEALLNAYVDAGRWDEARGLAYAATARRRECERSEYPEIRLETERLRPWSPDDIEEIRRERERGQNAEGPPPGPAGQEPPRTT